MQALYPRPDEHAAVRTDLKAIFVSLELSRSTWAITSRWRTRLYYADDYAVYGVLLPVGQLYTGKDETHGIERDNARQRHGLARFRRRSIVVATAKRMVDVSIALFARFASNNRIGDLISMLG